MIFFNKKHKSQIYINLLNLSRNIFFYKKTSLQDNFETRIYLMFIHFSIILIIFKKVKIRFPQDKYDDLFYCIENNLRELGFGDVAVNKKMKIFNKILYDILLKINKSEEQIKINKSLIYKYCPEFGKLSNKEFTLFDQYFLNFYHFCFELPTETMIKESLNFRG